LGGVFFYMKTIGKSKWAIGRAPDAKGDWTGPAPKTWSRKRRPRQPLRGGGAKKNLQSRYVMFRPFTTVHLTQRQMATRQGAGLGSATGNPTVPSCVWKIATYISVHKVFLGQLGGTLHGQGELIGKKDRSGPGHRATPGLNGTTEIC